MTRLLASVTSVLEASQALAGGADIIDLKNPQQGALGALPLETIKKIVDFVGGRVPVSATIGDLPMQAAIVADRVRATADTGVDIVKIGLFGQLGHAECIAALAPLAASGVRVVAVLFADTTPDLQVLPELALAGFHGVMLDTADKNSGRLLDCLPLALLSDFLQTSRGLDLLTGLAGSLRLEDVRALTSLSPDYLGFRGALCPAGDRNAALDPTRLQAVKSLLREYNSMACAAA